ncbi:YbhB/YbcL family Raf kinase inhibitor-like protein [Salinibacterium sp. ZJ454]|uniref:YbhB/YbcL family Raf kinase inhibitor-like protein n=1 Tax=Salinibacterium sp. ZJ454 TaxID=2708339 RepID=UPI00141E0203|nr:YbhB/YbcL family Raf kinase inhibitor-like protein [Salinibacterium sp. ZJ454]
MGLNIADLTVASPHIDNLSRIPDSFTADGGNLVPTITVSGVPAEAVELALICHDPDAPLAHGFTHWVVYGLPARNGVIDTSQPQVRSAASGTGQPGWFGPQPPLGHGDHHYYFWVYALANAVEGEPTREEFLAAHADDIVEQNRLVGTYSR